MTNTQIKFLSVAFGASLGAWLLLVCALVNIGEQEKGLAALKSRVAALEARPAAPRPVVVRRTQYVNTYTGPANVNLPAGCKAFVINKSGVVYGVKMLPPPVARKMGVKPWPGN